MDKAIKKDTYTYLQIQRTLVCFRIVRLLIYYTTKIQQKTKHYLLYHKLVLSPEIVNYCNTLFVSIILKLAEYVLLLYQILQ